MFVQCVPLRKSQLVLNQRPDAAFIAKCSSAQIALSSRSRVIDHVHALNPCCKAESPEALLEADHVVSQVMYAVVHADQRPEIPADMPADYSALMQSCWTSDIGLRHGPLPPCL